MTRLSLQTRLVRFLQDNPGWHASGSLQRMEWRIRDGKLATPQNIGRRLRELENEGKVQVEHRKNHAWYSAQENGPKKREQVVETLANNTVRVSYKEVALF